MQTKDAGPENSPPWLTPNSLLLLVPVAFIICLAATAQSSYDAPFDDTLPMICTVMPILSISEGESLMNQHFKGMGLVDENAIAVRGAGMTGIADRASILE